MWSTNGSTTSEKAMFMVWLSRHVLIVWLTLVVASSTRIITSPSHSSSGTSVAAAATATTTAVDVDVDVKDHNDRHAHRVLKNIITALSQPTYLPTPQPSTQAPTPLPSVLTFAPSGPSPRPSPAPTPTRGLKAMLTFSYTGSVQQWVVPTGVATFTVDAYGAAGSDYFNQVVKNGGLGGYISVSNIAASSFVGKTLLIYIGAAGAFNTAPGLGGGGGRVSGDTDNYASGGGATDLRTSLTDLSSR